MTNNKILVVKVVGVVLFLAVISSSLCTHFICPYDGTLSSIISFVLGFVWGSGGVTYYLCHKEE